MTTTNVSFSFNTDAEGWVFDTTGASGITAGWSSGVESTNDPTAGSGGFSCVRDGKSLSNGAPFLYLYGNWEALGVPVGETVTAVNMGYDWECSIYSTGATSQQGPAELWDASTLTLGTFSTANSVSSTTSWATQSGTQITGLSLASDTNAYLVIYSIPKTGSSKTAQVSLDTDYINIAIESEVVAGGSRRIFVT